MRKVAFIALLVGTLCLGGIAGLVLYGALKPVHQSKVAVSDEPQKSLYVSDEIEAIKNVNGQPVQDVTYPNGSKTKAMAGELLVKITDQTTISELGSKLTPRAYSPQTYMYKVASGTDLLEAAAELKKKPGVVWAEPNYLATTSAGPIPRNEPNDPQLGTQTNLLEISAPEAWSVATGGAPVAVLDTGVQFDHPDLVGKVTTGYDFVNNDAGADDDNGHGTEVAGIIGAATNNANGIAGVSWGSPIIPIKVVDKNGVPNFGWIEQGIRYAMTRGARVISISISVPCPAEGSCIRSSLMDAINAARAQGIVVVASSGNNETNRVNEPASYPGVIAVGGADIGAAVSRTPTSNYGPELALIAPNRVFTTTTGSAYDFFSGTSAATPQVAAVAALVLGVRPDLSPDRVKAILMATANGGSNQEVGAGRVNAYRAVMYAKTCP